MPQWAKCQELVRKSVTVSAVFGPLAALHPVRYVAAIRTALIRGVSAQRRDEVGFEVDGGTGRDLEICQMYDMQVTEL